MSDLDVGLFVERQVDAVREALGREKALIAVSGGVDSTVSAVITHMAIGSNLVCVFIDDNFMRLGEQEMVRKLLSSPPLNLPVKIHGARERFMGALGGLGDAEEKRKAFRDTFYKTLGDIARAEGCRFLVQGTIKADIVETQGGIKTQHNILEQIGIDPVERFGFRVVEPVASLYKHQVRDVARFLGTPPEVSERQPFPGPGLSVRVVGEITLEKLEELKRATAIVEDALGVHGADQYFAAIFGGSSTEAPNSLRREASEALGLDPSKVEVRYLGEKATGMIGGRRIYGHVAAIRMLEDPKREAAIDYKLIEKVRSKIQRSHPEVSRVLLLVKETGETGYTIAMRAIRTKDFMTATLAEIPLQTLRAAAEGIFRTCRTVSSVYMDVTPKPPGTIEFE